MTTHSMSWMLAPVQPSNGANVALFELIEKTQTCEVFALWLEEGLRLPTAQVCLSNQQQGPIFLDG